MNIKDVPDFEPEGFSKQIFVDRYAFTEEETWKECCERVARQMALAEKPEKQEKYRERFYDVLVKNLFTPGGRIWYGSGRPNPAMINCFVLTPDDSKEGWAELLRETTITLMAGGGVGSDYSLIRPDGAEITGHRGECSGPIGLMKGVNAVAEMVRAGGGRRSALMMSLDLEHPDVLKFLDAKLKNGEISLANISVKINHTKKFVEAVKNDGKWEVSWKGKYKREISAKTLWNRIVKNAWDSADPGVLNFEFAREESPSEYHSEIRTSNPCGEQLLSSTPGKGGGSCCLGHIVLPRFINENKTVNWEMLGEVTRLAVRFLDNVLDVNSYPLPDQKEQSQKERRIGLGVTGLADFLTVLKLKYGGEEANKMVDKLFRFISKQSYEGSVFLAAEKGSFPACIPEKHVKTGFVRRMTPKIKSLILEHGIRNTCLLSCAPTGTVSIVSGNCSSGLEPMFAPAYYRNFWKGKDRARELVFHPLFKRALEAGEDVLHFVNASDISPKQHLEVQKVIQKHVDGAVSKTCQLPNKFPLKELSEIWLKYLPYLKGTTFYREGSRNFIDENGVEHEPPLVAIPLKEAVKLYQKHKEEAKTEAAPVNDCPKGVCEL